MDIAKLVLFHRKMAKLTQKELADLSGVGKTALFHLEHGKGATELPTLLKVLRALNIRIEFQSPLMHLYRANPQ